MRSRLFNRRRSLHFAALLRAGEGGPPPHRRRRTDPQLQAMVGLTRRLAELPAEPPSADFRQALRALLVATAQRQADDTGPAGEATGTGGGRSTGARSPSAVGVSAGRLRTIVMSWVRPANC